MERLTLVSLLLSTLVSPASAQLSIPIKRQPVEIEARSLRGRSSPAVTTLTNNVTLGAYQASVTVGTPPQTLVLQVDTGSSDTYIVDISADQCHSASLQQQYGPCVGGQFDSTKSSTFNDSFPNAFSITYGDGTGSSGDYISDVFTISGASVQGQLLGLAKQTTVGYGLMGIGYDTNEATQPTIYPSVIDQLFNQSLIPAKAYSMYLDDLTSASGTIIFGGADTGKFIGNLVSVPIQKEQDSTGTDIYKEFLVEVKSISVNTGSATTAVTPASYSEPYLLDSGTTTTRFSSSIVSAFVSAFGASSSGSSYTVPCSAKGQFNKGFITFTFANSAVINVPMDEWIYPVSGSSSTCQLAIGVATQPPYILGDTFIRSAYVVYDLANNQIGLAQTNFESTVQNVVAFSATATSIPSLTGQATGTTLEPKSAAGKVGPADMRGLAILAVPGLLAALAGTMFLF